MDEKDDDLIEIDGLPVMALDENFGDPETLLNSRDWLQSAVEAKGAKMLGGGVGMGQADIDVEIEGCEYNISIRPLVKLAPIDQQDVDWANSVIQDKGAD